MDGSYSKRVAISSSKKKQATGLEDTVGSRDETGDLCNRIAKGTKHKSLEKPKHLKPSFGSSSSKETRGSSSKKFQKSVENREKKVCSKTESSGVSTDHYIQELDSSGSHTGKLKSKNTEVRKEESSLRDQNSELNNGRGKSSSSGKGKKIIGVSRNEGRVSDPKNSRKVTSSKTNGVSSAKNRKSKGSIKRQTSSVITEMSRARELSLNGDHSTGESSTDRATVGFANDNARGHYNIDGIADVLLALDGHEQDEELTYEQLLSLEANLFFGGLNFHDQHRDMRLDIDNMSYEELLVLEEKMGTVSTALSEEELSKCIKTSIYECLQSENRKIRRCVDDNKCSICQEEFVGGDEVGRLGCGHGYHTPCINHWLGLKNWCPICKASPTPAY